MTEAHAPIRKVFGAGEFRSALKSAAVSKSIVVQTWSSFEETERFLILAQETDFLIGVVGWVDLTSQKVGKCLDDLMSRPEGKWLVGVRHQVHDEPDSNWLMRHDVLSGLQQVEQRGLTYDLLVRPRELPASIKVAERFPTLRLVVDHIGKPEIGKDGFDTWFAALQPLAEHRSHVWIKLSGMVTEADWNSWKPDQIRPYIEAVIKIFGPDRCMLGSDWPVCLLATTYQQTINLVRDVISELSNEKQDAILWKSAASAYRLAARM